MRLGTNASAETSRRGTRAANRKASHKKVTGFYCNLVAGEHFEQYWKPESLMYEMVDLKS